MRKLLAAFVVAAAVVAGVAAQPAPGVVHEIYAAWCAGKGEIVPPGLSDGTKKSFAAPVLRAGVATVRPYLDGYLIDFDFDKPQSKIVPAPTGDPIVQIAPGLYLERFILDPDFPGFLNCAKLESLSG